MTSIGKIVTVTAKYGDKAPPSVLGGKSVPVSQPVGAKKKGKKWQNRPQA